MQRTQQLGAIIAICSLPDDASDSLLETAPLWSSLQQAGALLGRIHGHLLGVDRSCCKLTSDRHKAKLGHKIHVSSDIVFSPLASLWQVSENPMALLERG